MKNTNPFEEEKEEEFMNFDLRLNFGHPKEEIANPYPVIEDEEPIDLEDEDKEE